MTQSRHLLLVLAALLLAGCTVQFTPGDAKPGTFSPYPTGAASSGGTAEGAGMRGGPNNPP